MIRPIIYSTRSPIWNKPFIYEEWRRVEHPFILNADGPVWVSNLGRVANENKLQLINPWPDSKNRGDLYIAYKVTINGVSLRKRKNILLARSIMMLFDPISNPENYTVNHIDGNHTNNCLYNLSWCTNLENTLFAYMNGQMVYYNKNGDRIKRSILSPDMVDRICQLLKDGVDINTISDITGVRYQRIHGIATGHVYKDKYYKYGLNNVNCNINKPHKNLTEDEINTICKMLYNQISIDDIANTINCKPSTIKAIKYGTSHPGVYKKYRAQKEGGNMFI